MYFSFIDKPMKSSILLFGLIYLLFTNSFAQTQYDLNMAAFKSADSSYQQLSTIERQLVAGFRDDSLSIKRFNRAINKWKVFVQAQLEFKFPKNGAHYGVDPMCYQIYRQYLIEQRIKELKDMIISEEGDVCGSIKIKEQ